MAALLVISAAVALVAAIIFTAPSSTALAPAPPVAAPTLAPSAVPTLTQPPTPALTVQTTAAWLAGHDRDWRVGRVAGYPAVVLIEFPGLAAQGRTMNRLAALLEKAGAPRNRVLDDASLQQLILRTGATGESFYQGHDYRGEGIARFYTLAQQQGLALNADERRLRDVLLQAGLLQAAGGYWQAPGEQALVTFTATQAHGAAGRDDEVIDADRRAAILAHELSHGRFFTDPGYRTFCERFWRTEVPAADQSRLLHLLATLQYDTQDPVLVVNEAQALLGHTPDARAFSAALAGMDAATLRHLQQRFAALQPPLVLPP